MHAKHEQILKFHIIKPKRVLITGVTIKTKSELITGVTINQN